MSLPSKPLPANKSYQSTSYDESLSGHYLTAQVIAGGGSFVMTFVGVGAMHDKERTAFENIFSSAMDGLFEMSFETYLITLVVAIILSVVVVMFVSSIFDDRKIIVGLTFNDTEKIVTLRIRMLSGLNFIEKKSSYGSIRLVDERLSDGRQGPMYPCITFYEKGIVLGHFYRDHDMWQAYNEREIEADIRKRF